MKKFTERVTKYLQVCSIAVLYIFVMALCGASRRKIAVRDTRVCQHAGVIPRFEICVLKSADNLKKKTQWGHTDSHFKNWEKNWRVMQKWIKEINVH